jgi:uncharacterized protein
VPSCRRPAGRGIGKFVDTRPRILVDADACPVKDEIYRVAFRMIVPVTVVSNTPLRVPQHPLITRVVVSGAFDAADDWIAERADGAAVVVTADILLADRCLKKDAAVIAPNGRLLTSNSIGDAVAVRAIMSDLRAGGDRVGGPPPFRREDRSRFLSALDAAVNQAIRKLASPVRDAGSRPDPNTAPPRG